MTDQERKEALDAINNADFFDLMRALFPDKKYCALTLIGNGGNVFKTIRQALSQPVREWQPIETAPRDGTLILARNNSELFITKWDQDICDDGWGMIHSCCGYYEDQKPTHWMPLPQPPEEE